MIGHMPTPVLATICLVLIKNEKVKKLNKIKNNNNEVNIEDGDIRQQVITRLPDTSSVEARVLHSNHAHSEHYDGISFGETASKHSDKLLISSSL